MFEKIKSILVKYTEAEEITPNSQLNSDLGLSSFDVVEIVSDFEDSFNIKISDKDIENFISISDIMEYFNKRGIS